MRRYLARPLAAGTLALVLLTGTAAGAQSLSELSLEDLMRLDAGRVFGASERSQPVTEAPSSVSFITAEDIARYGYRSLADILHGVRGLYVSDDRNFSFVGARGFGKPGDYNSRILLLVNGHRVNDNVFGQAEIGAEFGLDPATFERVEIIRGPASSLYGDSAFFAVVNVITRTGAAIDGASVTLRDGLQRHAAGARDGRQVACPTVSTMPSRARSNSRTAFEPLLPRVRYAGDELRCRRRARRPAFRAVLRPSRIRQLHVHRCLRPPPQGRADGVVRHAVQRADRAANRPSTVIRWSTSEYAPSGRRVARHAERRLRPLHVQRVLPLLGRTLRPASRSSDSMRCSARRGPSAAASRDHCPGRY